ncbi:MAG: glutamate--tRNA ligase [bacterium]
MNEFHSEAPSGSASAESHASSGPSHPRLRFSVALSGPVSIGDARVALINHLTAQKKGGTWLLRLDDSHPEKTTPETVQGLYDDLKWLKIEWQEGPDRPGKAGPYRQSERGDLYQQHLRQLLEQGKAYPCYCTPEKLDEEKRRFLSAGKPPRYTGTCRALTPEARAEFESQGLKPLIRLKVDRQIVKFRDGVYGDFTVDSDTIGDWVLALADGRPTPNFVAVVDDALMKINQVIRAENELSTTATQILLYRSFGWEAPSYAHIPLVLGADRTLLSKKHGLSTVQDLRERGFLPPAVLHYLIQLGTNFVEGRRFPKWDELAQQFGIERIQRSSPIFDENELKRINAQYLRQLGEEEFLALAEKYVPTYGEIVREKGDEWTRATLLSLREKCRTFQEVGDYLRELTRAPEAFTDDAKKALALKDAPRLLKILTEDLSQAPVLNLDSISDLMENAKQKLKSKNKNVFGSLQAALTGATEGHDLPLLVSLLGKEECLKRIQYALTTLQHAPAK